MAPEQTHEYDAALVTVLKAVWGKGYMFPGGPDELCSIVNGVALADSAAGTCCVERRDGMVAGSMP
jgi:hypothetical protein